MVDQDLSFTKIFNLYNWKEIPNCPGRYLLAKEDNQRLKVISPISLLNNQIPIEIFTSEMCQDRIHIGKLPNGGLLSYEKSDDATFVHTLNNSAGLQRKMNHLNIHFSCENIDK
ncbi:unnamed protein product [Rotaria magnacalcarata]|uniref:Uncharacterized protein n=1 Tax=Rotaria magnacalcarata TaxID=392030 RepID=A0A816ZHN2_9BILA|nr:unnamed protein product [Rotaria magnacalcarata]CAF2206175.1 unnamed protein product [Rotaria magnacalcarata]CAF4195811.1 unnamed protein product [Rotaria magnacalcarata]CAF4235155.1 unnamed protein product [Rotaria magnacalcarata]